MAKKPVKKEVATDVEGAMQLIRAKYGQHAIMRASEAKFLNVTRLPTGVAALDFATGGGYPFGRYVHIFGKEGSGKTYLCMKAVAIMQKIFPNAQAVWLDIEQVFDPARAKKIGVDLSRLIVIREPNIEASIRQAEEFLPLLDVKLYIVDSVAGIVTSAELDGDMEDQTMGMGARLINRFLRRWTGKSSPTKNRPPHSLVLLTNQVRESIKKGFVGMVPPKPKPTGGHGLRFFASIELEVARGDRINLSEKDDDADETVVGFETKVLVVKNNTFAPLRSAHFMLCVRPFKAGDYRLDAQEVDNPADIIRYAVHNGVMERSGAWLIYDAVAGLKWQGKLAAQAFLQENPDIQQEIYHKVMGAIYVKLGLEAPAVEKTAAKKPPARIGSIPKKFGKKAPGKR